MSALPFQLEMQERVLPLRPRRRGTARRMPRRSPAGEGLRTAQRAASLDTDKYLATSVREWLQQTESPRDKRRLQLHQQGILRETLEKIWHPQDGNEPINAQRQRDWERLGGCQAEWIGFRADCCSGETVAVPIGCNHRLCVLCNSHRAAAYRERVARLFDHIQNPVFLTLTVPNVRRLSKRTYAAFRDRLKKLLKQHGGWIHGGLYSIETTFNREKRTWHVHAHVLVDARFPLPVSHHAFVQFKRRIEFDWLSHTSRSRINFTFAEWQRAIATRKAVSAGGGVDGAAIPRRIVDVRPVRNREGAAREVLKYITKVTAFADDAQAVEEFLTAVKHTRMVQTFGSWYGFKFSEDVNDPKDWKKLQCACGKNHWQQLGLFFKHEVTMDPEGRWRLTPTAAYLPLPHERKPPDRHGPKWKAEIKKLAEAKKA